MVVAINADAFSPWPAPFDNEHAHRFAGLAVSDGTLVSRGSGTPSLLQTKSGDLRIARTDQNTDTADIELAVSGFGLCLIDGQPQPGGDDLHPRTGLGLSADNRVIVAVTIDGRQPASAGATTQEVGQWLKYFGAYQGINMDGGGSTTMAWWDPTASGEDKCQTAQRPGRQRREGRVRARRAVRAHGTRQRQQPGCVDRGGWHGCSRAEPFLVRGSQASAAIVLGPDSGPFHRWVASEVQRYVRELSGAELPIVTTDGVPPDRPLVLLGNPATNRWWPLPSKRNACSSRD